ncbi:MAG: hypothetical protein WDA12_05040 [Bacilli bacterium]
MIVIALTALGIAITIALVYGVAVKIVLIDWLAFAGLLYIIALLVYWLIWF